MKRLLRPVAALVIVVAGMSGAIGSESAAAATGAGAVVAPAPVRSGPAPEAAVQARLVPDRLAYGSFDVFQTWTMRGARASMIESGRFKGYCTLTVSVLVQEIEKHGVVRLRTDFELRGPDAPGWTGWVLHTGYFATRYFPDDSTSYHHIFQLPAGYLRYPPNLVFSLWIKTVGDRFGLPDYSRHYKLADVPCDDTSPGSIDFGQ